MKKDEIKVGSIYSTKHSGKMINARVLEKIVRNGFLAHSKTTTHWRCLNLTTNRDIEIKSAGKFIKEVIPEN